MDRSGFRCRQIFINIIFLALTVAIALGSLRVPSASAQAAPTLVITETPEPVLTHDPSLTPSGTPLQMPTETPTEEPAQTSTLQPTETPADHPNEEPTAEPALTATPAADIQAKAGECPPASPYRSEISVDGVAVVLCTPFDPGRFLQPQQTDFVQVAASLPAKGTPAVSLLAIPYGVKPPTEDLPAAKAGITSTYFQKIKAFRMGQNATFFNGEFISFFGQDIHPLISLVKSDGMDTSDGAAMLIAEWLAEAGGRVWLLRLRLDLQTVSSMQDVERHKNRFLNGITVSAADLSTPSAALTALQQPAPAEMLEFAGVADLPFPSWWRGECNVLNHPGSYPLGASFMGVKACGPRNTEVWVNFGVGVPQLEWQCPELSKRYMYLRYGIPPYSANGKDVVWRYPGDRLIKVPNGTVGMAPQAGDVLSYGSHTTYGHTSVVGASSVDSSGNGTITIIEQNYSSTGTRTHTVLNWRVLDSMTASGWLHDPAKISTTTTLVAVGQVITVNWADLNLSGHDWIGMHWEGETGYLAMRAIYSTFGTTTFTALGIAGKVYFRLYRDGYANADSELVIVALTVIPTPMFPKGDIYKRVPNYKWKPVEGATQYHIQVYQGATRVLNQVIDASVCGQEFCPVTPNKNLAFTDHRWQVRAYGGGEWKPFSAYKLFTVIQATPLTLGPSGTITDDRPIYSWSALSRATQYQLQVLQGETRVLNQIFDLSTCPSESCSVKPNKRLAANEYQWRVRAYLDGAWRAFSAVKNFRVAQTIPTPQSPEGLISQTRPTYIWTSVSRAASYQLQVFQRETRVLNQLFEESFCLGGICSVIPNRTLLPADYTWRVRAYVNGIWRAYSAAKSFSVSP